MHSWIKANFPSHLSFIPYFRVIIQKHRLLEKFLTSIQHSKWKQSCRSFHFERLFIFIYRLKNWYFCPNSLSYGLLIPLIWHISNTISLLLSIFKFWIYSHWLTHSQTTTIFSIFHLTEHDHLQSSDDISQCQISKFKTTLQPIVLCCAWGKDWQTRRGRSSQGRNQSGHTDTSCIYTCPLNIRLFHVDGSYQ